MYQIVPQIILVVSLTAIILIVLRRIPEVTVREDDAPDSGRDSPSLQTSKAASLLKTAAGKAAGVLRATATYAKEAKDYTVRAEYLQRFAKVLHFRRLTGSAKEPTVVITRNQIQRAEQLVQVDEFEQAEQAFIKIIERDPGNLEAYESLGKLYLNREKHKEALEVYEYLSKQHPEIAKYWAKLGLTCYNVADYSRAVDAYRRAVQINPQKPQWFANLSLCCSALREKTLALDAARAALALEPANASYLMLVADCCLETDHKTEARELLEKVLEIEPTSETAREKLMHLKF